MQGNLRAVLEPSGTIRQLAAGEVLCHADGVETDAYIVESGSIDALIETPDGEIVVATHGAGALVGEVTAVLGGRRTATLRATVASTIRVVPGPELVAALAADPVAGASVLAEARERGERTRVAGQIAQALQSNDSRIVAAIAEQVTWRHLQAGENLCQVGDDADAAYLVTAGRLRILNEDGEAINEAGRGEIIGESGLISDQTRTATVTALRDCTLARLSEEDFLALAEKDTKLALGLVARSLAKSRPYQLRAERAARLVAFIQVDDLGAAEVAADFFDALAAVDATMHLSPSRVAELLGTTPS